MKRIIFLITTIIFSWYSYAQNRWIELWGINSFITNGDTLKGPLILKEDIKNNSYLVYKDSSKVGELHHGTIRPEKWNVKMEYEDGKFYIYSNEVQMNKKITQKLKKLVGRHFSHASHLSHYSSAK